MNTAPMTSNPEAMALIRTAESKCEGCRTAWRLKGQHHVNGAWTMLCRAQAERSALRVIAASRRIRDAV
jgi:hypothetical protein